MTAHIIAESLPEPGPAHPLEPDYALHVPEGINQDLDYISQHGQIIEGILPSDFPGHANERVQLSYYLKNRTDPTFLRLWSLQIGDFKAKIVSSATNSGDTVNKVEIKRHPDTDLPETSPGYRVAGIEDIRLIQSVIDLIYTSR